MRCRASSMFGIDWFIHISTSCTKRLSFSWWYAENRFSINSDKYFFNVCSYRSNHQYSCNDSDNGLAPIRQQAIIWTNDSLMTHICVTWSKWIKEPQKYTTNYDITTNTGDDKKYVSCRIYEKHESGHHNASMCPPNDTSRCDVVPGEVLVIFYSTFLRLSIIPYHLCGPRDLIKNDVILC